MHVSLTNFLIILCGLTGLSKDLYAKHKVVSNYNVADDLWKIDNPQIHLKSVHFVAVATQPTARQLIELNKNESVPFVEENFDRFNILMVKVENKSSRTQTAFFSHFLKTHSQFFHFHNDKLSSVSPITYRNDVARTVIEPGTNTLFLVYFNKIRNFEPNIYGFQILDEKKFHERSEIKAYLFGAAFGMASLLLIFSFISFVFQKKFYFLFYAFYGISAAFIFLIVEGFLPINADYIYAAGTMHTIFAMIFVESILHIRKNSTLLIYAMNFILAFILVFGSYTYITVKDPFLFLSMGSLPITYMSLASFVRYKQGYKPAILFLTGFLFFWIGATISAIDNLYFSNSTNGLPALICWVIELALFKIATDAVQRRSEKKAITHSNHAFKQLEKVVYSHQIEQIKKGAIIESTMPIHKSEACVIVFDIIASSKIDHVKVKVFLRNLFRRCNEAMIENYDPQTLTSNAFRIKEMGDGFLCSVGYPFLSPSDNFANDAINLSFRFIEILQMEAQILESETPICCSIGIAFDYLQGFYPEGGTKEYDIFGRAIILATRYERLRKMIRPTDCNQSVIICQRRVMESASPQIRKNFDKVNLQEFDITVRDDTKAKDAFVKFIEHKSFSFENDTASKDPASHFDAVS